MIEQILPSKVGDYWHLIRKSAEVALPPYVENSEQSLVNILKCLINGDLQAYFIIGSVNNEAQLIGVVLTQISVDPITGSRNLTVFSIYAYTNVSIAVWGELKRFLQVYAKSQSCNKILTLTNDAGVIKLMEKFGASKLWSLMEMPIEEDSINGTDEEFEEIGPYTQQILPGTSIANSP